MFFARSLLVEFGRVFLHVERLSEPCHVPPAALILLIADFDSRVIGCTCRAYLLKIKATSPTAYGEVKHKLGLFAMLNLFRAIATNRKVDEMLKTRVDDELRHVGFG